MHSYIDEEWRYHYPAHHISIIIDRCYSKLFPTQFCLTRNNSKCFFVSPDFSPNHLQKYKLYLKFRIQKRKKIKKGCISSKTFLIQQPLLILYQFCELPSEYVSSDLVALSLDHLRIVKFSNQTLNRLHYGR